VSYRRAPRVELTPGSKHELERAEVQYWIAMGSMARLSAADALAHFEKALVLEPRHVPSAVGASMAALMLGRNAEALVLAQRALTREPEEPSALLRGVSSWWLGRRDDAERYVARVVAVQPGNAEFRRALARLRSGTLSR
jgi:Flp pilus assembly protein TadD